MDPKILLPKRKELTSTARNKHHDFVTGKLQVNVPEGAWRAGEAELEPDSHCWGALGSPPLPRPQFPLL